MLQCKLTAMQDTKLTDYWSILIISERLLRVLVAQSPEALHVRHLTVLVQIPVTVFVFCFFAVSISRLQILLFSARFCASTSIAPQASWLTVGTVWHGCRQLVLWHWIVWYLLALSDAGRPIRPILQPTTWQNQGKPFPKVSRMRD